MNVFAQLGYPFPLKNSQMQTMTAPHTWPHILAALDWLLGFVQVLVPLCHFCVQHL